MGKAEDIQQANLTQIITQMIDFQEANFGRVEQDPGMSRIPASLFLDFSQDGGVCQIFKAYFRAKCRRTLKSVEWNNPVKRDVIVDIFRNIRQALIDHDNSILLPMPKVIFICFNLK